jgi:hypothetical protein
MAGLSEDLIVALCPKPCRGPTTTSQHRLLPSGEVEVSGQPPPTLCDGCPERGADAGPLSTSRGCTVSPRQKTCGKLRASKAAPARQ